jgi:hypothetical protein
MIRIIIITVLFAAPLTLSQQGNLTWYKGNLHTHSLWSDGDAFPETAVSWYKEHGYHFIALSDHNILADHEKWVHMDRQDQAYLEYIKYFGGSAEERVEGDSVHVRLKRLDEYRPLFEEESKFIVIESEEITDRFMNKPVHINANNIREFIEPRGGSSLLEVMQNNINAVIVQRIRTGIPMFPHVNHPNFGWAITANEIINLKGDKFFEVYNGHPYVNNYGDSLHPSTEQMWDEILTERIRRGKGIMYGLAVDDAHNYLAEGLKNANPGRGWVMVRTSSLRADSLVIALERGDFYSSTGVELAELDVNEERIKIAVNTEEGINYIIRFTGSYKDTTEENKSVVFYQHKGILAEYYFQGIELFVRAEVISSKLKENPYREGEFEKAWIQPVVVNKKVLPHGFSW